MAEQNLNIYQKLAKIRKQVEVIQRNKKVMDTPTLVRMKSLQRFPGSWINTIYL